MTIARAHLVDPLVCRWYHCVTRCVRRAFLLGEGANNRKTWIENRLREHNFETPAEITPDFEKRFLDAVAWVVKDGNKIPEGMVDERTRMASADFYGGHGIGYHKGSARAISLGRIQNKGSFRNSMFEDPLSSSEKDGTAGLHEGMKDAMWGELSHYELPVESNRIIALVALGDGFVNAAGEPLVIEIREFSLRLGNFVERLNADNKDLIRVKEINQHVEDFLPKPEKPLPANATRAEKIIAGLEQYSVNVAKVEAALYVRRMFHGTNSESNTLINGGILDFGTSSTQPNHGPIFYLKHSSAFGSYEQLENQKISSPIDSVLGALDPSISSEIVKKLKWRSVRDAGRFFVQIFSREFTKFKGIEFLMMAGLPEPFATRIMETSEGRTFNNNLNSLAIKSQNRVNLNGDMPEKTATYDVLHLLEVLGRAQESSLDETHLRQALQPHLPQDEVSSLVSGYLNALKEAFTLGAQEGIAPETLSRFIRIQSQNKTKKITDLYMSNLRKSDNETTAAYLKTLDPAVVANNIESVLGRSRRTFKDVGAFEAVVSSQEDFLTGRHVRFVFDAKSNVFKKITKIPGSKDHVEIQNSADCVANINKAG